MGDNYCGSLGAKFATLTKGNKSAGRNEYGLAVPLDRPRPLEVHLRTVRYTRPTPDGIFLRPAMHLCVHRAVDREVNQSNGRQPVRQRRSPTPLDEERDSHISGHQAGATGEHRSVQWVCTTA